MLVQMTFGDLLEGLKMQGEGRQEVLDNIAPSLSDLAQALNVSLWTVSMLKKRGLFDDAICKATEHATLYDIKKAKENYARYKIKG